MASNDINVTAELGSHINANVSTPTPIPVNAANVGGPRGEPGQKGDPGTTDYNSLDNHPSINDITLLGNKSFEDLGAESLSNIEIDNIINSVV